MSIVTLNVNNHLFVMTLKKKDIVNKVLYECEYLKVECNLF